MKRSRFTEEQIIAVLREQEAGVSTADVCRKHGISTWRPLWAMAGETDPYAFFFGSGCCWSVPPSVERSGVKWAFKGMGRGRLKGWGEVVRVGGSSTETLMGIPGPR